METSLRTIGVLGGMGPAATVDFLSKVISATPARRDQDHIPMMVSNVPQIPDRSTAILAGSDAPLSALAAAVSSLEAAGAQVLAIPCNTAHFWFDALELGAHKPILHIVDAVGRRVDNTCLPIGLLATRGTIRAKIYQMRLGTLAERLLIPDEPEQDLVDAAIRDVKAGRSDFGQCESVVEALLAAGAGTVILGCTELPIALQNSPLRRYCIDATQALAEDCVAASRGELTVRRQ